MNTTHLPGKMRRGLGLTKDPAGEVAQGPTRHPLMSLPGRRETPLQGEVLRRTEDPDECPIREWEEPGGLPYAWSCTGGQHGGHGVHRTEAGRRTGIAQHHDLVAQARAAGHLATWTAA